MGSHRLPTKGLKNLMENNDPPEQLGDPPQTDQTTGQPIDPDFIPQDPVQLDRDWYTPANTTRNKGLVTKNMVLANIQPKQQRKIDLTIELINILDNIILDFQKKLTKKNTPNNEITEQIQPLLLTRNDIAIEHDALQACTRAYKGEAQKLSKTNRYQVRQDTTQTLTENPNQKKHKLIP